MTIMPTKHAIQLECKPDFDAALSGMATREVNERWQKQMGEFFEALDGKRPDEEMAPLEEVFHLD